MQVATIICREAPSVDSAVTLCGGKHRELAAVVNAALPSLMSAQGVA